MVVLEEKDKEIFLFNCNKYHFQVEEKITQIYVRSPISSWILDYSGDDVRLLHKSTRIHNKPNKKGWPRTDNDSYHIQIKNIKNITSIPGYIAKHDNYKKNIEPRQKS